MTSSIYMLLEFEWPRTKHTSRCFDTCVCAGSLQSIHGKHITIDICFRKLSHFFVGLCWWADWHHKWPCCLRKATVRLTQTLLRFPPGTPRLLRCRESSPKMNWHLDVTTIPFYTDQFIYIHLIASWHHPAGWPSSHPGKFIKFYVARFSNALVLTILITKTKSNYSKSWKSTVSSTPIKKKNLPWTGFDFDSLSSSQTTSGYSVDAPAPAEDQKDLGTSLWVSQCRRHHWAQALQELSPSRQSSTTWSQPQECYKWKETSTSWSWTFVLVIKAINMRPKSLVVSRGSLWITRSAIVYHFKSYDDIIHQTCKTEFTSVCVVCHSSLQL